MSRKKGRTRCPEPFNTLIDLAGAACFDYIVKKRRHKNGGRRSNIDPYEVAGIAFGMGKLESTEDILKLGGMLGAMGAFDDDKSDVDPCTSASIACGTEEVAQFGRPDITLEQLGKAYGVSVRDYATRDEFIEALNMLRFSSQKPEMGKVNICTANRTEYQVCRVSDLANGAIHVGLTGDMSVSPGCLVQVTFTNSSSVTGIVLSVDKTDDHQLHTLPVVTRIDDSNI